MRHIDKSTEEPHFFTEWKRKANPGWQPTFQTMPSAIKKDLKAVLTKEQLGICCYCEAKLLDNYSHIEHFRPQENYPNLSLDYANMLCSCQSNLKKGDPRHCGNAKGSWFDNTLTLSPLDLNCSEHFNYTGDGHVYPANKHDMAARETIEHLALDIPELVASRQSVLDTFLDDEISDEDFKKFYYKYFERISAENPPEFISAITAVFARKGA